MIGLATGALVAAVWQGILLAAVVALGLRLLPKTPAAVRFAIWFGVFLVVTALPMASVWPHAAGVSAGGHRAWLTIDARWSLVIAAVWAMASLVRAVTLVVAGFRVRALWKRANPVSQDVSPWSTTSNMGHPGSLLSRRAQLCVSDEVDRPTVIGFFAPKIVIPGWLMEKLTPAELEQVVLHEAGHLGRADDWMNLLQKIALVVFPLNPALAWVERKLCFERELAVDERVLRAFSGKAGAATAYAACLATVAEHRLGRRGFALALGALGRESELGRRVGRILRRGEMMRPAQARLVLGGALLGLVGAAAGLERCPQLVGFAANTPTMAQADMVNVDGPRMSSVALRGLGTGMNAPHEVLMKASLGPVVDASKSVPQRLKPQPGEPGYGTAKAVSLTRTDAAGKTEVASSDSAAEDRVVAHPEQRPERVMQWVVVTEWQGEDGASRTSRMVMTTATTTNPAGRTSRVHSDMDSISDEQPDQEQAHRYAAVPVRGGWLVFQL
jgi:beta-lactamase regulating signal transducer with metallopeptidase domain